MEVSSVWGLEDSSQQRLELVLSDVWWQAGHMLALPAKFMGCDSYLHHSHFQVLHTTKVGIENIPFIKTQCNRFHLGL